MTLNANEIEAAIDEIADELKLAQTKLDRLRALAREAETDRRSTRGTFGNERYEIAASAFRRHGFEFDDLKVRRTCQKHADQDGFAVKLGKWHVRLPQFDIFAEQVKSGTERF